MKLWGGRFKNSESTLMEEFNSSFSFDKRLFKEDIEGSIVHAEMLKNASIISEEEYISIVDALTELLNGIIDGKMELAGDYEDIHSFVEFRLIEKIGPAGKKLHTARSRNDQVALDMKLYARKASENVLQLLVSLNETIKAAADNNPFMMPGYTHMQRAQVVTFKHHLMAYYNMFTRDIKRIGNALDIMNESPLGCCALAGTTYDIDRNFTSHKLGFSKPVDNFLDGVSDRDYCLELLSCFSIIMVHLSRLSEEIILWSTKEFGFVEVDDSFSTGSSIMPQKKNPDSAELIRGKSGRVFGSLMALLTVMKGIPLAYNKDMQEDKESFFDAVDTVNLCLSVMTGIIGSLKINEARMNDAVKQGFLNATDAADYLVMKGVPFRDAHKISGEIVLYCEENSKVIEDLSIEEFKTFSDLFEENIYKYINYKNTLERGIKKIMK